MAKEDEVLKRYLDDNERYADLINGVSFGGRQVVRPEDLSDRDTQTGYHTNARPMKGKKNTKYRDLFRKTSFGANFMVIGVENQKTGCIPVLPSCCIMETIGMGVWTCMVCWILLISRKNFAEW